MDSTLITAGAVVLLIFGGFVSYRFFSKSDDDDYETDEGGSRRKIRHGNL